jgi:hypothetical protein
MRNLFVKIFLSAVLCILFAGCRKIDKLSNDTAGGSVLGGSANGLPGDPTCGCVSMPPVGITKNLVTDFGAVPNDGQDDSKAFLCAANWLNNNWNSAYVVQLYIPDGTYNAGIQLAPGQSISTNCGVTITNNTSQVRTPVDMIKLTNARNIVIYGGENTIINYNTNLYYGGFNSSLISVPAIMPNVAEIGGFINLFHSSCISIRNLKINGSNAHLVQLGQIGGPGQDAYQMYHDGIVIEGSHNVSVTDVKTNNFCRDGILVMDGSGVQIPQCPTFINVESNYNSRQGMSLTAAEKLTATNCTFNKTSTVFASSPGCGLDIEPAFPGNTVTYATFTNCKFLENKFCGMISDNHPKTVDYITFDGCEFSTGPAGAGTYALWPYVMSNTVFQNCIIRGPSVHTAGISAKNLLKFNACTITDWNSGSLVGGAGQYLIDNGWGENFFEFNTCSFEFHKSRIITITSLPPGTQRDRYFIKNDFKAWVGDLLTSGILPYGGGGWNGYLGAINNSTLRSNIFLEDAPVYNNNAVKYWLCMSINTGNSSIDNDTDGQNTFGQQDGANGNPYSRFVRNNDCAGWYFYRSTF